jgi:predicted Fe-S protein YdhL (DUF1289 family)
VSCKACGSSSGLEPCPYCGHSYCGNHRGTLDGGVACTGCLREEHERKARAKATKAEREERLAREKAVSENEPLPGEAEELAPLPEPAGASPILIGGAAGLPAGAYAWWAFGKMPAAEELPSWAPVAGAVVVALVAGLGVWAIVKTRQSR